MAASSAIEAMGCLRKGKAESAIMPQSALRTVPKARVLPLERIAAHLVTIAPPRPPTARTAGVHVT